MPTIMILEIMCTVRQKQEIAIALLQAACNKHEHFLHVQFSMTLLNMITILSFCWPQLCSYMDFRKRYLQSLDCYN